MIKRNWLNLKDKEWVGDSDDYYGTVYEKGKYVCILIFAVIKFVETELKSC